MRLNIVPLLKSHPTVLILAVSTTLLTSGQGMIIPIIPLYTDSLGASTVVIGLVISVFGLARLITNMPAALIAQKFGRRLPLVVGPFLAALGNALSGTAVSLEALLIFRFLAGIGSAAFITGAVIFIGDMSTPDNRGRMMSIYQGSFILGISLGPALGGLIAEGFGLRAPFFFVAFTSLLSGIWALLKLPESRPLPDGNISDNKLGNGKRVNDESAENIHTSGRNLFVSKGFILISLIFFATFFIRGGALFTLLPLIASNYLYMSPGQIGAIFTIPPVIGFVLLPFSGSISDQYGRKKTIVPGLSIVAIGLLTLGVSSIPFWFVVGMVIYGIGSGIEGPTHVAYVADISPQPKQAMAQGLARSIGDLALLTAPPMVGLASDIVGTTTVLLTIGLSVGILSVAFMLFAKETSGSPFVVQSK